VRVAWRTVYLAHDVRHERSVALGRELFHRNGADEMVAVAVTTGEAFRVEGVEILFPAGAYLRGVGHPQYDVLPDDQGFVMLQVGGLDDPGELILIDNWHLALPNRP
jgi:hypothetical protein